MLVTLIGGGWDPAYSQCLYAPFVTAATHLAQGTPRISLVLLDEGGGISRDVQRFEAALSAAGDVDVVPVALPIGGSVPFDLVTGAHGVLVGGGLTPAYAEAWAPVSSRFRAWCVEQARPYVGFSAGAAIAATHAVVGGWRHDGEQVCPEEAGEDLDEIRVEPGLGLVPFTVEVHANAWGTTPRLKVALAMLGRGIEGDAIDENTAVIVEGTTRRVVGAGTARCLQAP